jgi:hypothetical protein
MFKNKMKKVISLIFVASPLLAHACAGEVIPSSIRNIILWVAPIALAGSLLVIIGYTISYFIARSGWKIKIISVSLAVLFLSAFAIIFVFATAKLLCASPTQF